MNVENKEREYDRMGCTCYSSGYDPDCPKCGPKKGNTVAGESGAPAPTQPTQLVIDLCRELYDRFVMGGWEPKDAHRQVAEMVGRLQKPDENRLQTLLIETIKLAIVRHDLRYEEGEQLPEVAVNELAEDTALAVQGIGTCNESPIPEWIAVVGAPAPVQDPPTKREG